MRGMPSILSLFRNESKNSKNIGARILDSFLLFYDANFILNSNFWSENVKGDAVICVTFM